MLNALKGFNARSLSPDRWLNTPSGVRLTRQVFIVLATLLLAFAFGRQPSLNYIYILVALVVIWFLFTHPEAGIIGLVFAALVIPFELGTGSGSALNAAFLGVPILGGLWVIEMAHNRAIQIAPSSTTLPLVGFILTATISFIVGYLPWNVFAQLAPLRAQLGAWGIFIFSALAFWLAANRIRTLVWLKRLVWLFLLLGGIYIVSRLFGTPGSLVGRFFTFGSVGSLFWVWVVVLAAGQALFNHDLAWRWRLATGGLVV